MHWLAINGWILAEARLGRHMERAIVWVLPRSPVDILNGQTLVVGTAPVVSQSQLFDQRYRLIGQWHVVVAGRNTDPTRASNR